MTTKKNGHSKKSTKGKLERYAITLGEIRQHISRWGFITLKEAGTLMKMNEVSSTLARHAAKLGYLEKYPADKTNGHEVAYYKWGKIQWPAELATLAKLVEKDMVAFIKANKQKYEANKAKKQQVKAQENGHQADTADPGKEKTEKPAIVSTPPDLFTQGPENATGSPWKIELKPTDSMDLLHDMTAVGAKYHSDPEKLKKAMSIMLVLHSGGEYFEKVEKILQFCVA